MAYKPPATPKEYAPQYYIRIFKKLGKSDVEKTQKTNTSVEAVINPWDRTYNDFRKKFEQMNDSEKEKEELWELKQETVNSFEWNPQNVLSIRTSKDIGSPAGRWSIELDYRYGYIDENNAFIQIEPMDYVEIFLRRKQPEVSEGVLIKDANGNPAPMGVFRRKLKNFKKYDENKKTSNIDIAAEAENPIMSGLDDTGQFYPDLEFVYPFVRETKYNTDGKLISEGVRNRPLTIEEKVDNPDFVLCGFVDSIQNNFNISSGEPQNRLVISGKCVGKILEEHNIFFNPSDPVSILALKAAQFSIPTLTAVNAIDFLLHNFLQNVLDPDSKILFDTSKSKEYRNSVSWLQGDRSFSIMQGSGKGNKITTTTHNAPPMSRFINWAQDIETRWGRMEEHSYSSVHAVGNVSDGPLWSKLQQMSNSNLNEFWVDETGNIVLRLCKHAWGSPTKRIDREDTMYGFEEKEQFVDNYIGVLKSTTIVLNPDFGGTYANSDGSNASYKNINEQGQILPYTESQYNLLICQTIQNKLKRQGTNVILINTKGENLTPEKRVSYVRGKCKNPLVYLTISVSNMTHSTIFKDMPGYMFLRTVGSEKEKKMVDYLKVSCAENFSNMFNSGVLQVGPLEIKQYRGSTNSFEHLVMREQELKSVAGAIIVRPMNIIPRPQEDDSALFVDAYGKVNQGAIDIIADAIIGGLRNYRVIEDGAIDNQRVTVPVKVIIPYPQRVKRRWGGDHIFINRKDIQSWTFIKSDDDLKTLVQVVPAATVLGTTARASSNFGQVPITSTIYNQTIKNLQDQIKSINDQINVKSKQQAPSDKVKRQLQKELAAKKSELDQAQKKLWRLSREQQLSHLGSYNLFPMNLQDVVKNRAELARYRDKLSKTTNHTERVNIKNQIMLLEKLVDLDRPIKSFWQRFGIRPLSVSDIFNWRAEDLIDSAMTMFQMYGNQWWKGTITVKGDSRYKIGRIVEIPELNLSFYCTGVEHNFQWGESWTTNLTVTRGDLANSPYDSLKHIASEKITLSEGSSQVNQSWQKDLKKLGVNL